MPRRRFPALFLTLSCTATLAGSLVALAQTPPASQPAAQARAGGRGNRGPTIPMTEPADFPMVRVDQGWSARHTANLVRAQQGDVDLYLLGDSITDNWGSPAFRDSYTKYFSGWKTADFGIGGDRTEHVLWRIQNGELDGNLHPKVIMLQIGTNNLPKTQYNYSADTPEQTAAGVKAILDVIHQKQPQAKVLLVSVFPRDNGSDASFGVPEKVKTLNTLIAKFADGNQVKFLDIHDKFLGPDGKLLPGVLQPDNLHPTAAGYDIWGAAITPILTDWLGQPTPPANP